MKKVLFLVLVSLPFLTGCVVPPIYGGYGGVGYSGYGAYGMSNHPVMHGIHRDAYHYKNMIYRGDNFPGKIRHTNSIGGPRSPVGIPTSSVR